MKKRLMALAMAVVLSLGLTACGEAEEVKGNDYLSAEEATSLAEYYTDQIVQIYSYYSDGLDELYLGLKKDTSADYTPYIQAIQSYAETTTELGDGATVVTGSSDIVTVTEDEITVHVQLEGTKEYKPGVKRTATAEVVIEKTDLSSLSVTVDYDFGEMMGQAGMNTLLGMGTVFVILILISLVIVAMGAIMRATEEAIRKKKEASDLSAKSVENTVSNIIDREENSSTDVTDDLELVAVITAAIAASEGSASSDGFVVRSIIRR